MSTEEKLQTEEETRALKEAMSFVVGKKLPLPKNWSGVELEQLEFPKDLSKLTSTQLGEVLGIWSTVMAYAQYEAARTDIEKTAKGNRYEFEKKKLHLVLLEDIRMNEEQRKAEIYVQTGKLQADFEIAKAKYTLTNALLGVYSKYYQALSRELSRRGLEGGERAPKDQPEGDDDIRMLQEQSRSQLTKEWGNVDESIDLTEDEVDFDE